MPRCESHFSLARFLCLYVKDLNPNSSTILCFSWDSEMSEKPGRVSQLEILEVLLPNCYLCGRWRHQTLLNRFLK